MDITVGTWDSRGLVMEFDGAASAGCQPIARRLTRNEDSTDSDRPMIWDEGRGNGPTQGVTNRLHVRLTLPAIHTFSPNVSILTSETSFQRMQDRCMKEKTAPGSKDTETRPKTQDRGWTGDCCTQLTLPLSLRTKRGRNKILTVLGTMPSSSFC